MLSKRSNKKVSINKNLAVQSSVMILANTKVFDLIIIGGGSSGMMAAAAASMNMSSVDKASSSTKTLGESPDSLPSILILEKNESLGRKLLITGGGRCNVTNNKTDIRTMLGKYKGSDQFLYSAFAQHSVSDTIKFFKDRDLEFKEENDGRMFPVTDKAQSVYNVLFKIIKDNKVNIKYKTIVKSITKTKASSETSSTDLANKDSVIDSINEKNNTFIIKTNMAAYTAKKVIIATGGMSHGETGSTGDGFTLLSSLGHSVTESEASLVPISLTGDWYQRLSGISIDNVSVTTFLDNVKQQKNIGKILFTHTGLSGPGILQMSKHISELLKYGQVTLSLDFFPTIDEAELKKKLHLLLSLESNKKVKNVLPALVPTALVPHILRMSQTDEDTPCHSVMRDQRLRIIKNLKTLNMEVKGLLGLHKAIISSGGVALSEIDFKTMQSRIVPGLYVTGDLLNIDRPSGGYSLQLCWTTGWVAGNSASKN